MEHIWTQCGMHLFVTVTTVCACEEICSVNSNSCIQGLLITILGCFYYYQVQKRVQIRMEALQKYIDSILARACKMVTEQFASSGFSISDPDLPEICPGGIMCGPTDTLSSSVFNQLSVSSIDSHSPGGKPSPSGMEGPPLLLQKSPELKRRSSWTVTANSEVGSDVQYGGDKEMVVQSCGSWLSPGSRMCCVCHGIMIPASLAHLKYWLVSYCRLC